MAAQDSKAENFSHERRAAVDSVCRSMGAIFAEYAWIQKDRAINAAFSEAYGLMRAYAVADITVGTERLSYLLREIIDRWPETQDVDQRLFNCLSDCAAAGLTVEGNDLLPNERRKPQHFR